MATLYLVKPGILSRKDNSLKFVDKDGNRRDIPIKEVEKIVCLAPVSLTSGIIKIASKENITIFFINKYGSLYNVLEPPNNTISGKVLIEQVNAFLTRRVNIAKKFVLGSYLNMVKFLSRYNYKIRDLKEKIENCNDINELMGYESIIWKSSYKILSDITGFEFNERSKRPPKNELNSLISFINTLLYADLINEGKKTYLNLAVSFLHQPQDSRFSLALDVAEVFKPVIVFPLITYLINKKIIKKEDFEKIGEGVLINKNGKKKVLLEYEKKIRSTIYVNQLRRKVSYRTLFKLEFYKLLKDFLNDNEYKPYLHKF